MWSSARSEASLEAALPVPIEIRRLKNARRLRLRFDEAAGMLKLTCPWRTSRRSALAWALGQREWIDAQIARAGPAEPFAPGASIPLEGREVRIVWREEWQRSLGGERGTQCPATSPNMPPPLRQFLAP
jgi:predicted metal-dependent hydrolase